MNINQNCLSGYGLACEMVEPKTTDEPFIIDSDLCNRHGSLRVGLVRKHYGLISEDLGSYIDKKGERKTVKVKVQKRSLTKEDIDGLISNYVVWRDTIEFLPLRFTYLEPTIWNFKDSPMDAKLWCDSFTERTGRKTFRVGDTVGFDKEKSDWKVKQTVKRGNEPYIYLVKQKLKPLLEREPLEYFSTELNDNRKRKRYTNLLYITGTIDQSLFNGLADAWLNFGSLWNCFITNLRQQFGKAEYMRTWQSQENGYPHFHALVWIPFDFSVIPWFDDDGRLTWRIHNRQKLKKGDKVTVRERLKDAWKGGNLDIIAVSDIGNAFKDMVKYITRDLEGGESDLTNAMVWYFGKQSYSISKHFEKSLWGTDAIDWREPSNDDLINAESNNSNLKLIRVEVFPIVPKENLDFSKQFPQKSILELDEEPKPPPKYFDYLEDLTVLCEPIKVNKKKGIEYIVYDWKDWQ
jgi:hypothetical protein